MGKQEIIDKLTPLYFKGKSERMKERFLAKDIDRQYASLINWQYRNEKRKKEEKPEEYILQAIEALRTEIRNAKMLQPEHFDKFRNALNGIMAELDYAETRAKTNLIAQLERQQAEIAQRISDLKDE